MKTAPYLDSRAGIPFSDSLFAVQGQTKIAQSGRAINAADEAAVSFRDVRRAYFPGDELDVHVSVQSQSQGMRGDFYAVIWTPGLRNVIFLTGDPLNPLSMVPTALRTDVGAGSHDYQVLRFKLPDLAQGLELFFYAALVNAGTPVTEASFISNIAQANTRIIGNSSNEADRKQTAFMRTLRTISGPDTYRAKTAKGALKRLDLELAIPKTLLPPASGDDDLALTLLSATQDLLRVETPRRSFRLVKRAGQGVRTLTFRQYYNDVPVYGSWLQMTIQDREGSFLLKNMAGKYVPDLLLASSEPTLSALEARLRVMKAYGIKSLDKLRVPVPLKLWIYDEALFTPVCPKCPDVNHNPRLAWRVVFESPAHGGVLTDAFVDAVTGDILRSQPRIDDNGMHIRSANGNTLSMCADTDDSVAWLDEDGVCKTLASCSGWNPCYWDTPHTCASPDAEGFTAFDLGHLIDRFYNDVFGRRSYEDSDSTVYRIILDVSFAPDGDNAKSEQCGAYEIHKFSNGYATEDIMGHEFGHSFHWSEVSYDRTGQSGAIKEHIADMFGHFFAAWSGLDPDWQHGEHIPGGGGRDLANPSRDHIDDYNFAPVNAANDWGEVHANSTILSKAAYLMTAGDTHPDTGMHVGGIGEVKSRQIY
ncbi:MAG TPA: M4 family metallopeptidase, partial [Dissulfurispiraceae bacterium]|nr:M4 family metallopeptidase [Dissulfurispiraceae bacterium]